MLSGGRLRSAIPAATRPHFHCKTRMMEVDEKQKVKRRGAGEGRWRNQTYSGRPKENGHGAGLVRHPAVQFRVLGRLAVNKVAEARKQRLASDGRHVQLSQTARCEFIGCAGRRGKTTMCIVHLRETMCIHFPDYKSHLILISSFSIWLRQSHGFDAIPPPVRSGRLSTTNLCMPCGHASGSRVRGGTSGRMRNKMYNTREEEKVWNQSVYCF